MRYPCGEDREDPGQAHVSGQDRAVIGFVTVRSGVQKVAGGSPAARTTVSAKVLVVRPCLCSRPGAVLLNVVTCSAESPETHHCQRTFVDLRVSCPKVEPVPG